MQGKSIYIGENQLHHDNKKVTGDYTKIDGETFYKISNYEKMDPFFISIISSSDHWMFISSNGGLTAGRRNPNNALFPYYNDDVIHSSHHTTGSKTIVHIHIGDKKYLWEPFSENWEGHYQITRNIYKNIPGNKILYEEINEDLELTFQYSWTNSEKYGFIKSSKIRNISQQKVDLEILDGIQNILPSGLYQQFQNEYSTLADGYKKNELIIDFGIGVFSLSSIPTDRAEPSESLRATMVWSSGIPVSNYLLSSRQIKEFRVGNEITNEADIRAAKGAYFIKSNFQLDRDASNDWIFAADINKDITDIIKIENLIKNNVDIINHVEEDIKLGTKNLIEIVASSDGLQQSNDKLGTSRHFSNVLFNCMRGGIFDDSYKIDKNDFIVFLKGANKLIYDTHKDYFEKLPKNLSYFDFISHSQNLNDSRLEKIALEYLPLIFSRRHGDPSRPWNRFSIDIKNDKNEKILNYQGNWRDIFQNWEALSISYPAYIDSMVTKFLNASTADGYNPYRVTREGFDWEVPESNTPWSNIGYWGDHQIIYLLKLLEQFNNYNPALLNERLFKELYSFANIPYKIKKYEELLSNPHDTIVYDNSSDEKIKKREKEIGSDGKYLFDKDDQLIQVTLAEKLLVTLLSKLSNFIPTGGIWMNTQRPEWNDANNALVGNGISMVTLYYLRRFVVFCQQLFNEFDSEEFSISEDVFILFNGISQNLNDNRDLLNGILSNEQRKIIVDQFGSAGSTFREKIYKNFSATKKDVLNQSILDFLDVVLEYLDHTIKFNHRSDGLYHSYNIMILENEEIKVSHLYEMLEGQVAVLSSGYLSCKESIELLAALRNSKLYRADQNSYILYPDRQLPYFVDRNNIPKDKFNSSELLQKLVSDRYSDIVIQDEDGQAHFSPDIRNAQVLANRMECVSYSNMEMDKERNQVLDIYESIFYHRAFTGRSGTFYKYEGLGSIYWHMVSKLVLAVQEVFFVAIKMDAKKDELELLKNFYYDIKDGVGVKKSPEDYGAFPTDPYSHTPSFSGVQQPGMTGQVKEDIISRYGELGVSLNNGKIRFNPSLLDKMEFLENMEHFSYYDVSNEIKEIILDKNSLAYTYCQVPIIYRISEVESLNINYGNGEIIKNDSLIMSSKDSESILRRDGSIKMLEVNFNI